MNKAIEKLLHERYYLGTENSWEELAERISHIYPPSLESIKSKTFIPSSPTLMNGNTNGKRKGTLSSCFTMGIEDSIEGIFEALKEAALVTKASGGVGYVFSNLRSSNETIKTINRKSSGPIPFLKVFDKMLDGVSQGGSRKGAGMAQFNITHPDILSVIRLKETEGTLERLNISIRIPDQFYKDLKENPNEPHTCFDSEGLWCIIKDENGKVITNQDIWNEIIDKAWNSAEPGIFNIDIAHRQCTTTNLNDTVLSNPCQPAFATVLTPNGIRTIGEINIGDYIWSGKQFTTVINKWSTGSKSVYSYNTSTGSFIGTKNHRIVQNDEKIEVKDANSIDQCRVDQCRVLLDNGFDEKTIMDGLVIGDGTVHKASNNLVYLCIGENDSDYFNSEIKHLIIKDRRIAFKYGWEIDTTITYLELPRVEERIIPERYYKGNRKQILSFLRGLYSANGSICGNRITLKQSSLKLIKQVQEMLSFIGISSYYTINEPKNVVFSNGVYECKKSYDLNITQDRNIFNEKIGFIQSYKNEKVNQIINNIKERNYRKTTYDINSIDYLDEYEVFDLTVEAEEHTYWSGGLLVSNCAEFVNIPYASCNLGSLNLVNFVKEDRTFDFEKFDKEIRLATRFLDSVIDVNDYPLEKIKDVTLKVRPIGLGAMALGDALYKMRIPYNSDVAYQLVERLFFLLTMVSMHESIQMAKEIGESYPAFDYDLFIKANERFSMSNEIKEDLKKYGVRNSCFTSIAPNGSISYLAGMLSGGIEPVYALAYSRRIEKGNKDYEIVYIVDPVFDEYLKENYTNKIYLDILEKITKGNGSCQNIEEIPLEDRKVFITANDLIPTEHLKMLAIVAKNTSLSVSKTINMASTATKEDISEVYQKAHDLGVIGVTVYRDGCRQGILTTGTSKEEEVGSIKDNHAPKRPKKLQAHLYPITVKGNKFGVVVGMLQDRPYEVFAFVDSDNSVRHCNGELIKETKGRYTFVCEDIRIENIQLAGDAERAVTILASQLLRHGVPINNIISTIKKISDGITDFTTAVARVLTKYTKNGDETGDVCPECGTKIIFENGCKVCKSCGYSGCG